MSDKSLVIWSNAHYPADVQALLQREAAPHRLAWAEERHASNLAAGRVDAKLAEADVAFGQPDAQGVLSSPRLRWVHLTTAGYTRYDNDAFRSAAKANGLTLTTSSTVYAEPCAQHLAAFLYAHARRLPDAARAQLGERLWDSAAIRRNSVLLGGQRVLIYGFGSIGRRLAELLAPLRMEIIGVRRRSSGDEPVRVVTVDEADALLTETDFIVNVLPSNAASDGFFDRRRLERAKRGVVFMNVGRGTTVDQPALQQALATGHVSAAYLDVTDPEPLPPEHPLWAMPNCFITPHSAGGFSGEHEAIVHHFLSNLRRWERGDTPADRVV